MSSSPRISGGALACALMLSACGGGGGSSGTPPPPPPPPPAADTTAPETTLTTTTTSLTTQTSATLTATSSEPGSTLEASLDGATYVVIVSPYTLNNLADGEHTLNVRARDAAGNVDATPSSFTWRVDATGPAATILYPGPQAYTDGATITVRGTAQDAGIIDSLRVGGVAAAATSPNYATWSAQVSLAPGLNSLDLVSTDAAGNSRTQAGSALITRGGYVGSIGSLHFDQARGRLLIADRTTNLLLGMSPGSTNVEVVAGRARGTGPDFGGVDVTSGNIAYAVGADQLIAIDLVSGNRTVVSPDSPALETSISAANLACNSPCTTVYAMSATYQDSNLFAIDVATGVRTMISANTPVMELQLGYPRALVYDLSGTVSYPRVLLQAGLADTIYEVNLQTGARQPFSRAGLRGAGPEMRDVTQMRIDVANSQIIAMDCDLSGTSAGCFGRLVAINLSNGDRTVITESTTDVSLLESQLFALDTTPGNVRIYVQAGSGMQIARLDYSSPTRPFAVMHDVVVGTGPRLSSGTAIVSQRSGSSLSLIAMTNWPTAGILRVDPATGNRTLLSASSGPGTGPELYGSSSLWVDTRAGAPANRVLLLQAGNSNGDYHLLGVDLATGNRSELMPPSISYWSQNFALDASGNRVLADHSNWTTSTHTLNGFDIGSGSQTLISGGGVGSGPVLQSLTAVGIDERAGTARRFLAVEAGYQMHSIEPASGNRSLLTGFGAQFAGPMLDNADHLVVDTPRRRAFLVNRSQGTILSVDLDNGNRTVISGANTDGSNRGTGPGLMHLVTAMTYDAEANVLYCIVNARTIVAVDVVTGDRTLISR